MVGNSSNSVKEDNMEDIERHHIEMDEGEFSDGLPYKPSLMDHSRCVQAAKPLQCHAGTDGDTGGGKEERLLQVEEVNIWQE
ncbi:hypothetical protein JHK84_048000 [Glycine max]|nr:hypothetical protein JHK86_047974 [Glycine max]KAG5103031.1 hypothetical protein JHK84_048000 [Glycine max]